MTLEANKACGTCATELCPYSSPYREKFAKDTSPDGLWRFCGFWVPNGILRIYLGSEERIMELE